MYGLWFYGYPDTEVKQCVAKQHSDYGDNLIMNTVVMLIGLWNVKLLSLWVYSIMPGRDCIITYFIWTGIMT